jgi:hypothetical protein
VRDKARAREIGTDADIYAGWQATLAKGTIANLSAPPIFPVTLAEASAPANAATQAAFAAHDAVGEVSRRHQGGGTAQSSQEERFNRLNAVRRPVIDATLRVFARAIAITD